MVNSLTERVKNLKVSWKFHEDRIVDKVIFVDESETRTVVRPKGVRYSSSFTPEEFAKYLYQAFHVQKSFEQLNRS